MQSDVRITFGMIVLNGDPFIQYNLGSIYNWASQIIVVEGACRTSSSCATKDGHSIDNTLIEISKFKALNDPRGIVELVTAKDEGFEDGFWPEKTEMCQAFAKRATGNYLWQVDSDEFYHEQDMPKIIEMLRAGIGRIAFDQLSFWGGFDYINDGLFLAEFGRNGIPRVFSWGPGYQYISHRPATVIDDMGLDVCLRKSMSSREMRRRKIFMYHYCLVFPRQVRNKTQYYNTPSQEKIRQHGGINRSIKSWENESFRQISRPFHLHNVQHSLSWIKPFKGNHPHQIQRLIEDIKNNRLHEELRRIDDIELLMSTFSYVTATKVLNLLVSFVTHPLFYFGFRMIRSAVYKIRAVKKLALKGSRPTI
jgi:hypothetical protein